MKSLLLVFLGIPGVMAFAFALAVTPRNSIEAAQPVPGRQVLPYPSLPAEAPAPTLTMERLTQIGEHTQTYIVHDTQEHQCALVIRDVSPVGSFRDPHWNVSITALPWACAEVRK